MPTIHKFQIAPGRCSYHVCDPVVFYSSGSIGNGGNPFARVFRKSRWTYYGLTNLQQLEVITDQNGGRKTRSVEKLPSRNDRDRQT